MMAESLEELTRLAVHGDRIALEKLVEGIRDLIYNLSLRMLWNPADAEDASQDILIKVITNLSQFQMKSKFTTWVYRIATNHLINARKRGLEKQTLSFNAFGKGIEAGFEPEQPADVSGVDRKLLAEELKISCTHAMLLCLDRKERIIFILSSIFGISSLEGASILGITPANYRKKLSRVRERMRSFMEKYCGLANHDTSCSCNRRIEVAAANNRINPNQLVFVNLPLSEKAFITGCKEEMEVFDRVSSIFAAHPFYKAPESLVESLVESLKRLITSEQFKVLTH